MDFIFPKSCGGLLVGAIFIAASAVELIAGLVLLYSDYAYILSAPNFWTATMNVIVGCLLGLAASVWKQNPDKKISTVIIQYKLIATLQLSAIIGNATTCAILFVGEGSTLGHIIIEANEKNSAATINKELFGYAFAASVISPALCIAACTVSLVWNCCPTRTKNQNKLPKLFEPRKEPRKSILKSSDDYYQWIYSSGDFIMDRNPLKTISISSGSDCDYGFPSKGLHFTSPCKTRCCYQSTNSEDFNSPPFCDDAENYGRSLHCETLDATFTSPYAGEIIPVHIGRLSKTPGRIGKPVPSPVPPDHWSSQTFVKTPILSSFAQSPSSDEKFLSVPKVSDLQKSPISHSGKMQKNERLKRSSHQAERIQMHEMREEKLKKVSPMDAIVEDAQETHAQYMSRISPSTRTSGYGSSSDIPGSCSFLPTPPPRLTSSLSTCLYEPTSKKRSSLADPVFANDEVMASPKFLSLELKPRWISTGFLGLRPKSPFSMFKPLQKSQRLFQENGNNVVEGDVWI